MSALLAALILVSVVAAAIGGLIGVCFGFVKAEADPRSYPVLALLTRRSNPVLNLAVSILGWALLVYVVPKLAFSAFGISDITAFGISFGLQIAFFAAGVLVGERLWKRIA